MNNREENNTSFSSDEQLSGNPQTDKAKVTHNLDTGEDEPLQDLDEKNIMDFGSGSGGGSAGDGGAS